MKPWGIYLEHGCLRVRARWRSGGQSDLCCFTAATREIAVFC